MSNVYVRLSEAEITKILEALSRNPQLETENLASKIKLLKSEMQPGTTLTLEAVTKERKQTRAS